MVYIQMPFVSRDFVKSGDTINCIKGTVCIFYAEKCSDYVEDVDVSKLCGSAPLDPVRYRLKELFLHWSQCG